MSPNGDYLATGRTAIPFQAFLGGGFALPGALPPLPHPGFSFTRPFVENPIQVWDTRSGNPAGTYLKETGAWNHAFSPSFRYMAAWDGGPDAAEDKNFFYLVDLQAKKQMSLPLKGTTDSPFLFSPQEKFVVVFEESDKEKKTFYLVSTTTGKLVNTFHGATFHGFTVDETLIVYEAQMMTGVDLQIWHTAREKVVHTLPRVNKTAFSPTGQTVAASTPEGWVFLDLTTFKTRRFDANEKFVLKALFSPEGGNLATFCAGGKLEFWDASIGKVRRGEFPINQESAVSYCFFSPNGSYLCLVLSNPHILAVWDVSSATLLWSKEMSGIHEPPGFTLDSRFLACYLDEKVVRLHVFETETGKTSHVLPPYDWVFVNFPGKVRFLTALTKIPAQPHLLKKLLGDWWPGQGQTTTQQVRTIDVASGAELARLESAGLEEGYHSEDGRTLVTIHHEDSGYFIRVWDLPLRPPLLLVAGIPLALGVIVLLFSHWRARRRLRAEAAKVSSAS